MVRAKLWAVSTAAFVAIAAARSEEVAGPPSMEPQDAASHQAAVRLERPREFGYRIGDTLHVRASVDVPRGYEPEGRGFSAEGLPGWLELRERSWEMRDLEGGRRYDLRFVFQIFHAPDSVTRLVVPERPLRFHARAGGGEPVDAVIPAIEIAVAPITDRASPPASDYPVPPPSRAGIVAAAGALAALLLAGALGTVLERRRRRSRRFRAAHRRIERARDCGEAALELHRALEARAGSAVFARDLEPLLDGWPAARPLRADLDRFFTISEAIFYRDGGRPTAADCLDRIRELSRRLMEVERHA